MAKVRRRVKKARVESSSTSQDTQPQVQLTEQEQEQSKRFLIILGVVFALILMVFVVLQFVR